MPIVTSSGEIIEDDWIKIDETDPIDDKQHIILPIGRLGQEWSILESANISVGAELEVTDRVDDIEGFLSRLELVVLNFVAFTDGRAFSQARLLRERYGYQGNIRAQGEVLCDQMSFMQRCGIDQFALNSSELALLGQGAFSGLSHSYQPELKPVSHR